ncbi:hypothetical protein I302_105317 [Kwoniella bestiolae CBS 10118]|uniref:Uncharacterized protein n=1 Tax=Kwoniella bestiolae CBS 10118 TaxID=1296100 RepID=A0A1B9FST5_9TREE|nr:hypothetical protein I302_08602 [Kwoniella bestiolae CBS 10118]OCF21823.1 hypothetical protein I302_08602 [Kwoniella bestiolae CBS 10118]
MGSAFSTVRWESPTGGKFRIYSRFYDVYGLGTWKPVEVQERIIGHPAFERVGECLVRVELKPNGTHEIEFRKEKQWSAKQVRFLDCALDGLPAPYHWWGLVIIRPHLRIAKEAANKIASAKAAIPTAAPIAVSAPVPSPLPTPTVVTENKETKKVTISEEKVIDPAKQAASSPKEAVLVEPEKVEETVVVEKKTESAEKQDEALKPPEANSDGKKGKKKKAKE